MEIKKELLEELIVEVFYQEQEKMIKEEVLSFAKQELLERKLREKIKEKINLREKDKDDEDEEDKLNPKQDPDSIFNQAMKSSASGDKIKVMTAYGDASHPDHQKAVALVQKAKEKDPGLDIPDPGNRGDGSSGEMSKDVDDTSDKSDTEKSDDLFKPTVIDPQKSDTVYKSADGEDMKDPKDRPGYIYGDDEIKLPTFARDLPLYWKLKMQAGQEDEIQTASPVKTFVYKQKKRKRGPRVAPGGFR